MTSSLPVATIKKHKGHDSRAIANEILKMGLEKDITMSMMKLIKLVYFAHGWVLGLTQRKLCSDHAEAWKYGPVFRNLYYDLPYEGSEVVKVPILDKNQKPYTPTESLTDDEIKIMQRVIDVYGRLNAFQLSAITHEEGSPWDTAIKLGLFCPISNEELMGYFSKKAI